MMKNYRSTIIGFTTLIVLLSAGAAQSLAGSNTVFSDDIVDGTITHADVKANSIGGSRLLDNAVTGAKLLNNTVTGADVNESTLALGPVIQVYDASTTNVPTTNSVVANTGVVPAGGGGIYIVNATAVLRQVGGPGRPECWVSKNGSTSGENTDGPFTSAQISDTTTASAIAITKTATLAAGDTLSMVCFQQLGTTLHVGVDEKSIVAFRISP